MSMCYNSKVLPQSGPVLIFKLLSKDNYFKLKYNRLDNDTLNNLFPPFE